MSNDTNRLYKFNQKCQSIGDENVWVEFAALNRDYQPVDLGPVLKKNRKKNEA